MERDAENYRRFALAATAPLIQLFGGRQECRSMIFTFKIVRCSFVFFLILTSYSFSGGNIHSIINKVPGLKFDLANKILYVDTELIKNPPNLIFIEANPKKYGNHILFKIDEGSVNLSAVTLKGAADKLTFLVEGDLVHVNWNGIKHVTESVHVRLHENKIILGPGRLVTHFFGMENAEQSASVDADKPRR